MDCEIGFVKRKPMGQYNQSETLTIQLKLCVFGSLPACCFDFDIKYSHLIHHYHNIPIYRNLIYS